MNTHSGFKTKHLPVVFEDIKEFGIDDTTPSVAGGNLFLTSTGHTAARSITMLDGGINGQVVSIIGANNTYKTTILAGANMNLQGNWVEVANATITLMFDGIGWYELSRTPITSASLMWSDLFLASGGVINWANGNATITHSTGLLSFAGDAYFANDVGIGDSTPGYPLKIYSAPADATDKAQEIDFRPQVTDNVTAYFIGLDILMSTAVIASGKTNSGYNYGIFIRNYANNENFLGLLVDDVGLYSAVGINTCGAGGTITNAIGILARVLNADADGTVTNGTGLKVSNSQVTGTMTNRYGIVIDSMAGAGTLVKGISVGALSGTQVTKHGIDIGAISGASTTNYGLQIGNVSGATTNYSIYTGTGDIRLGGAVTLVTGVNLMVGGATLEAGSTNTIGIANGTAPNAHVDNQVILFSADSGDATATLGIYAEQAVEAIGTFTASHKFKVNINGAFYWLTLDAV